MYQLMVYTGFEIRLFLFIVTNSKSCRMVYRKITDSLLQKIAIEELNEEPSRIEEYLQHIREWLEKEPHLRVRSEDQWLLVFLRGCKWSLQRSKEKIDYFYTVRTLIPELFLNRDPFSDDLQKFLTKGVVYPLPNTCKDGSKIFFYHYENIDIATMPLVNLFKLLLMLVDLLLEEDDNLVICGITLLIDAAKLPLPYLLQFTPTLMKKIILCLQHAYPIRIKNVVVLNSISALNKVYDTLCKPFLSHKLKDRIHMCGSKDTDKAYKVIPQSFWPEEIGGNNGSCKKLAEEWRIKVENRQDWFLEDAKYVNNESLRPNKPKTYNEEFNMEGSFRKLVID